MEDAIDGVVAKIRENVSRENLTPLERVRISNSFEEPDRVPSIIQVHDHAARLAGLHVREIVTEATKLVYAQLLAVERYGFDAPMICADMYNIEAEALGAKVKYPMDSIPIIVENPIREPRELRELVVPNFQKDGRMPYYLDVCRTYLEKVGDIMPISAVISAPLSLAINLRGYSNLLSDTRRDPDFVHELMKLTSFICTEWGKTIQSSCGIQHISLADAGGTLPNISPAIFEEFSLPYASWTIGKLGSCSWTSPCRGVRYFEDWRPWIRKILASGTTSLAAFPEDLEAGLDLKPFKDFAVRHKRPTTATVNAKLILSGPRQSIEQTVRQYVRAAAAGGGFSLAPGSIPYEAPSENVDAFMHALKKFGRYPVAT